MQNMLDLCNAFSADIDVRFNTTKSVAMRRRPKYGAVCADFTQCQVVLYSVCSL